MKQLMPQVQASLDGQRKGSIRLKSIFDKPLRVKFMCNQSPDCWGEEEVHVDFPEEGMVAEIDVTHSLDVKGSPANEERNYNHNWNGKKMS